MPDNFKKTFFSKAEQSAAIEAMFNAASLGIIISNAEGIIQQVNPYSTRLFGYEETELIGQKIEILIPRNLRDKHVGHREQFNQHPKARAMGSGMNLFGLKKDGSLLPVEISLTHYERNGKKEIVSFISDITERKKAEDALKALTQELEKKVEERTQELSQAFIELQHTNENLQRAEEEAREALSKEKELNELKSRFVSMASHEFRTPLSGILTSASLISKYDAAEDKEKRHKHINTIKASVQNLTTILNDFLSLDKLEQSKIECRLDSLDLKPWIQNLIEEMETLTKRGQRIVYEHFGNSSDIQTDKDMLRNIFINLLSNAIKYSGEEKEIRVTTEIQDTWVMLKVRDAGIGIPKNDQKYLFEKFFRAHNANAIQGTGLGLNIVKRYLDLMGGSIEFSSTENQGSTFTIRLPREMKV